MAFAPCLAEIERAAGRELSDGELKTLLKELDRRIQRAPANTADPTAQRLQIADDLAAELEVQAIVAKRNAALNLRRRIEAVVSVDWHSVPPKDLAPAVSEDDLYRVHWAGPSAKWRISRNSDNATISENHGSKEIARNELKGYLQAMAA